MNSIEKAFKKKERKQNSKIRKWWRKNRYNITKVLFFYIYIPWSLHEKYKDKQHKKNVYSDEMTKKYLDKILPGLAAYYEESPDLILFTTADDICGIDFRNLYHNWMGRKHTKQANYFMKNFYETKFFITNKYKIDGYKKMVIDNWTGWKKAMEMFGWHSGPYDSDHQIGVIFYKDSTVVKDEVENE